MAGARAAAFEPRGLVGHADRKVHPEKPGFARLSQVLSGNGSLVMSDGELSLAVLALSQASCWVLRAQFPPESIQSGSG